MFRLGVCGPSGSNIASLQLHHKEKKYKLQRLNSRLGSKCRSRATTATNTTSTMTTRMRTKDAHDAAPPAQLDSTAPAGHPRPIEINNRLIFASSHSDTSITVYARLGLVRNQGPLRAGRLLLLFW